MKVLTARLRMYHPNGGIIGSLPQPLSWEMGSPLNDMPSLTISYSSASAGADLLSDPAEVAVELRHPETGTFTEHPGCRFLLLRRARDLQQRGGAFSLTLPSYGWQMRKMRFTNATKRNKEGYRSFTNATPGTILKALIDEAHARGNAPGLVYNFGASTDSAGQAWGFELDVEYTFGQDLWSILDSLAGQGIVDWRFSGRTLQVYRANTTLDRNLTSASGIVFHPAVSHLEEPSDGTLEELASTVLVLGDEGSYRLLESPTALTPWGSWEETYQASGTKNTTTLNTLGQYALRLREQTRIEYTKRMVWREGMPVPFSDFRPGDRVKARNENGQMEAMRVHQITLSQGDTPDVYVNLVLNDRFSDRVLRNERILNRISGRGGPTSGGGSGGGSPTPRPINPETRIPLAPTGVLAGSDTYIDATGRPVARAEVTWELVINGEDGLPIDVDRYQLAARRTDLPFQLAVYTSVPHPGTAGFLDPLDAGYTYEVRVRALSLSGRAGDWSDAVFVDVALSEVPPPQPSAPVLTTKLATVKVEWDGLTAAGEEMPLDFTEVQVQMAVDATGPWVNIGEIFQGGSAVIATQLPVGSTRWFRFFAKNSSGVFSDLPSDASSITVQGIQGPDIEANSITANEIAAGTITAEEIAAYSLTVDRLSVGSENNLVADPMMANSVLRSHRLAVANLSTNTDASLTWLAASAFNGFWVRSGGVGGTTAYARFVLVNNTALSVSGVGGAPTIPSVGQVAQIIRAVKPGGNLKMRFTFFIDDQGTPWGPDAMVDILGYVIAYGRDGAAIGSALVAIPTRSFTAPIGNTVVESLDGVELPVGTVGVLPYVRVAVTNVPEGSDIAFVGMEVWQESSVYIGDGMVRTPLLATNAVTTDKLEANAITVKHTITGSFIRTAVSGIRVTMGPTSNYMGQPGIRIWTSDDGDLTTNIFNTDIEGTGGWDSRSFVIVGPETARNSTGRVDMNFRVGGGFYLRKAYVNEDSVYSGITTTDGGNELLLAGTLPRGTEIPDTYGVFRSFSSSLQNGSYTWPTNVGWIYRPFGSPRTSGSGAARYTSFYGVSSSGLTWVTSAGVDRVEILAFRGGYVFS